MEKIQSGGEMLVKKPEKDRKTEETEDLDEVEEEEKPKKARSPPKEELEDDEEDDEDLDLDEDDDEEDEEDLDPDDDDEDEDEDEPKKKPKKSKESKSKPKKKKKGSKKSEKSGGEGLAKFSFIAGLVAAILALINIPGWFIPFIGQWCSNCFMAPVGWIAFLAGIILGIISLAMGAGENKKKAVIGMVLCGVAFFLWIMFGVIRALLAWVF